MSVIVSNLFNTDNALSNCIPVQAFALYVAPYTMFLPALSLEFYLIYYILIDKT